MEPWVVDAKDINIKDEIEFFEQNLLLVSPAIDRFLDDQNKTETIVVAPKGFGKTLLLKAKRMRYAKQHSELIPQNSLIDKPSGAPSALKHKEYDKIRANEVYWKSLWLIALSLSILKYYNVKPDTKIRIFEQIEKEELDSPCDIFKFLLSIGRNDYFSAVEEYNFKLAPQIRRLHSPIAVFIDNVDEFFEGLLSSPGSEVTNELYQDYWYFSQLGLALAARDLNAINNHVKIFVSIRKEVFQKSISTNPLSLQLAGSSVDVRYSKSELIHILQNNIKIESNKRLASPNSRNLIARFFGEANLTIHHAITGDEEKMEDYLIRHTLRRPRDIAYIGRKIAGISGSERTQEKLKNEINIGGSEIAIAFIGEIKRHLSLFDEQLLFSLIDRNTLSMSELSVISQNYDKAFKRKYGLRSRKSLHVFCNLFKVGLLGYVTVDPESGRLVQRFAYPGETPLDASEILPKSEHYVIHPMLDDIIARHDSRYYRAMNKMNIIGFDRSWRETRQVFFVAKGDLKGYNKIMRDPDLSRAFPEFLKETVEKSCDRIRYFKLEQGDSLLICDENPSDVIDAIDAINSRVAEHYPGQSMRFGGSAGYVEIQDDAVSGLAILEAARVEPHVPPGKVLVTGAFKDAVRALGFKNLEIQAVQPADVPELREENGRFNFAKSDKEEPLWRELFHVSRTQPSLITRLLRA